MDLFAPSHIILILLVVFLFFGGKKIPELMRGLGKGMREFSDAKNNIRREVEDGMKEKENTIADKANGISTPVVPVSSN